MTSPSLHALAFAIEALVAEKERTTRRIKHSDTAEEADDLSQEVLDMQRAVSELAGLYESERSANGLYPRLEDVIAQGYARAAQP